MRGVGGVVAADTVIVGAGLCGLSAAYHLEQAGERDYLLLEREDTVGGLARTVRQDGFAFDHSIHILFSGDPYVADLIGVRLLAGNLRRQSRQSYCYTAGTFTEYPYQLNNFGLPVAIVRENLTGFFAACRESATARAPAPDFESWIHRTYGAGIARHFMVPYNRRQWAWDLRQMSYDWIGDRVAVPAFADVLAGALGPPRTRYGPNREFWYPRQGGIEALAQAFAARLPPERVWRHAAVTALDARRRELALADGRRIAYRRLISTAPLPALVRLAAAAVPPAAHDAANALRHNVVHTVNIGLDGTDVGPARTMHWVYLPEEGTVFHRVSFPTRFSPWMAPPGCSSIQAEISTSAHRPCHRDTLVRDVLDGLVTMGILAAGEARASAAGGRVRRADVVTLEPAYVIPDRQLRARLTTIRRALARWDITTCGRFGGWAYLNMDHAILDGRAAVEDTPATYAEAAEGGAR